MRVPEEEEFEDTKGVIRIRISKKNRQHQEIYSTMRVPDEDYSRRFIPQ